MYRGVLMMYLHSLVSVLTTGIRWLLPTELAILTFTPMIHAHSQLVEVCLNFLIQIFKKYLM